MSAVAESGLSFIGKTQIRTTDLSSVIDAFIDEFQILSLDCFDTLLWRHTAAPKDVFSVMQQKSLFQKHGVTAYQRINAAQRAYRYKYITYGHKQINLQDIYRNFTSLSAEQQHALAEEEILTEIDMCYAFAPMVELIRKIHALGKKIIIVSDTYFNEQQLGRILSHHLPQDVLNMVSAIFCSSEFATSKSENLFAIVREKMNLSADDFLHIGDHHVADFEAPRRAGLKAFHFLQFDHSVNAFLRLQHTASALTSLSNPNVNLQKSTKYSPFRGVFASKHLTAEKPEVSIGYMSFGPILYAFAKFITEEIKQLSDAGKRPKVFFLLRDAYLLSKACEAYAGEPVGKLVRIRKFVAVAASFRTQADVDHYISSITPQYFNFWVICEQLLLPREVTEKIIHLATTSSYPEQVFYKLIHEQAVLQLIFTNSAAYRERLKRYMQKEMQLEPGDTVILVDTGYIGVTQEYLTRTFKDELNITIEGRYFISSHEPDRPFCKSLITSTWCDHGLFEQSCTYKEGCVLDYDNDGNPIFDKIKLSDQQYEKVNALQLECLRFINDAKSFFSEMKNEPSFEILKETAVAALQRHIFFPLASEVKYFQTYQHDKDMGPQLTKTMFNVDDGVNLLHQHPQLSKLHPYEARNTSLDLTLSSLLQRSFELDVAADAISYRHETLQMVYVKGPHAKEIRVNAFNTFDDYYMFVTPQINGEEIAILFGEQYEWVQIDSIKLLGDAAQVNSNQHLVFDKMTQHNGNLFECLNKNSILIITPLPTSHGYAYQFIFRPVVKRHM